MAYVGGRIGPDLSHIGAIRGQAAAAPNWKRPYLDAFFSRVGFKNTVCL